MSHSALRVVERTETRELARFGEAGACLLRMEDRLRRAGNRVPAGLWLAELDATVDALREWTDDAGRGLDGSTMIALREDAAILRRCFVRLLRGVDVDVVAEAQDSLRRLLDRL